MEFKKMKKDLMIGCDAIGGEFEENYEIGICRKHFKRTNGETTENFGITMMVDNAQFRELRGKPTANIFLFSSSRGDNLDLRSGLYPHEIFGLGVPKTIRSERWNNGGRVKIETEDGFDAVITNRKDALVERIDIQIHKNGDRVWDGYLIKEVRYGRNE